MLRRKEVIKSQKQKLPKIFYRLRKACLLWVMSTETSVDIAVDIAVDTRSIVGRHSVDSRSTLDRQSVDIAVDSRSIVGR